MLSENLWTVSQAFKTQHISTALVDISSIKLLCRYPLTIDFLHIILCFQTTFRYKMWCCLHCIFRNKLILILPTSHIDPALKEHVIKMQDMLDLHTFEWFWKAIPQQFLRFESGLAIYGRSYKSPDDPFLHDTRRSRNWICNPDTQKAIPGCCSWSEIRTKFLF